MSQPFIEGMLLREIFRNGDNDFAICSILLTGHNASEEVLNAATKPVNESDLPNGFDADDFGAVSISGYFPKLDTTRSYRFSGKWHEHPRYGMQFQVTTFESKQVAISSDAATIAYLSSKTFKGIGKKAATAVVDALGSDAVNIILKDNKAINKVKGLTKTQKDVLVSTLVERQGDELVLGPLYSYGISPKFVVKIIKLYEKDALSIIQKNPYQLIADIDGIGFAKADEIARAIGIATDDPRRLRAAIVHVMSRMSAQDGHTFATPEQLIEMALEFLNKDAFVTPDMVHQQIAELVENEQLADEGGRLFLPLLLNAELRVARAVELLQESKMKEEKVIAKAFAAVKAAIDIEYSPHQEAAILTSLAAPVSIITGGPGTGKTTVVNGILKTYDELHKKAKKKPIIKLASPTGRAAKRVEETTGRMASTIHRLLEYSRDGTFAISDKEPLNADLVIIDEVSMLDTYLANQLITSLTAGTQIIFVGDDNQLPSVGPGQVLKDFIASEKIPITRLTEIHRQVEGSSVITMAHAINQGQLPPDLSEKLADRLFIPAYNEDILRLLEQVIKGAIAKGYTAKDVQVLVPMYRGPLGIDAVNVALQTLFNPAADDKIQLVVGQKIFREGDKVLQLVNNPDKDVMNGDVGEIVRVVDAGAKSEILVDFDGNEVSYSRDETLNALTHAYAMSIHKAQGSEYPVVIVPITRSYWIMLQRKIIYTGITRASQSLVLIGDYEALKYAAENEGKPRQTMLAARLMNQKIDTMPLNQTITIEPTENPYADYFLDHNIPFDGIDEEELAGRTPYDFLS